MKYHEKRTSILTALAAMSLWLAILATGSIQELKRTEKQKRIFIEWWRCDKTVSASLLVVTAITACYRGT